MRLGNLVGVAYFVQRAVANTESIVVDVKSVSSGDLVPGEPWTGQFEQWPNVTQAHRVSLGADPGRFFVRVCWPASEPADFDLEWEEPYIVVHATRRAVPIKPVDPVVRYTLVASPMVAGVPGDAWAIIQRIIVVILLASVAAALVWRGTIPI